MLTDVIFLFSWEDHPGRTDGPLGPHPPKGSVEEWFHYLYSGNWYQALDCLPVSSASALSNNAIPFPHVFRTLPLMVVCLFISYSDLFEIYLLT